MHSQEACGPTLDTHSPSHERSKLHRLSILWMFNSPVPKFPDFPQPSPLHLHPSDFPATPNVGRPMKYPGISGVGRCRLAMNTRRFWASAHLSVIQAMASNHVGTAALPGPG